MALTALQPVDINNIKYIPFDPPANQTAAGPPVGEINSTISMLGRRNDNNNVLIFSASTDQNCEALVSIDQSDDTALALDVVDDQGVNALITYYEVNVGFNLGRNAKWEQGVNASRSGRSKGKWVFVKGKKDDDDAKPGCLGFLMSFLP